MIYWYEQVLWGLITAVIIYCIKYYIFDGNDILLSIIDYFNRKQK